MIALRQSPAWAILKRLVLPVTFVVLALMPVAGLDRLPQLCVYRALFGVRCPGCGMTHAFCAVLHGDLRGAFDYNWLVVVAFPYFGSMTLRHAYQLIRMFGVSGLTV